MPAKILPHKKTAPDEKGSRRLTTKQFDRFEAIVYSIDGFHQMMKRSIGEEIEMETVASVFRPILDELWALEEELRDQNPPEFGEKEEGGD